MTFPKSISEGKQKGRAEARPRLGTFLCQSVSALASQRTLKDRNARPPQRIALRVTMRMHMIERMPIQMARNMTERSSAIRRRGLRQPRRVTDRAQIHRRHVHVIADRLQALQDRLPLFPIELLQERPQSLDEWIFQQRFAVRLRNKETVQADVQRFGDFLQRAEARRHLSALDPRQIRTRHLGLRLKLALRHPSRLPQLADALTNVLHRLLVGELVGHWLGPGLRLRLCLGNQELQPLRQRPYASPAVAGARPVLHQAAGLAAYDFPVHLKRVHRSLF